MKESKSIIEEIENSKKYDAVLMTTFNIEFSFFERYLLHLYLNNSIRHINVFVDSKQLNESLKDEMPLHFGKKYYVSPIDINGAFHPKVILMLGANKAKLIISSANIKMSGYMTNNEIFQTFYYDENNKEYESLIYESTEMFKKLNLMTEIPDRGTQKLLDKFKINQPTEYCQTRLLTSIDDSIFHQLQFLIHDEIKEIKAAVPFYDQHLTALEQLQETFQCKNTKLYIQNELNTFPVEYNKKYKKISNQSITVFDSILVDGKQKSSFYHGKVFEFVGKNNTYIFYGSANCTANALMRNKTENGNVECDVLEIKDPDEPSFFEGFVKTEKTELHSSLFSSITEEEIPFSFVYSNLNQNILQVYLKYQVRYNDLSFLYEKQELDFLYIDDMILLNIPVNLLNEQSCIFEIILKYNNQKTILRCWYIDQIKLDYYRNNITSMTFSAPAEGDDPEKFSEYYSAVFDALFNDETNEIIEEINEEMSVKLTTQSEDISEEESTEDITEFILDKDISDKFVEKNTMFHAAYESAKKLAPLYYNSLLQTGKHYSKNNIEHVDNSKEQKQQRTATSSEKRLSKTIKRNLKKHFLFINTTLLSYDYYLHLCGIVLYVIHQMRYKEKIVDFMSSEEVIQIKCKFSEILLEKYSNEQTDNDFMLLSRFVLMTIIELGIQKQRDKDGIARKLLLSLNKIRNIRESYTNILNELDTREVITENIPFGADTYIRKLYGYRTFEELVRFFEDTYHSKCIFNNNKSILDILIDSKAPEALADSIIREVVKYLHEYDHSKTMIRFSFFPADGKNAVFIVKLADYRINTVKKQVMQKKGKAEYRCILRDMRWIPIYF